MGVVLVARREASYVYSSSCKLFSELVLYTVVMRLIKEDAGKG